MKGIDYYHLLPEGVSSEKLALEFGYVLDQQEQLDTIALMQILDELSDRQWHTYSLLDESVKKRIETLLIFRWCDRLEVTELVLSIVIKLGLSEVWRMLVNMDEEKISYASRNAIKEAEFEVGPTVADPYSGLR